MKRIVLDTSIIVSSALGGALELILDKWTEDVFTVLVTSDIIAEYI
jgi:predicted nucleic acid-binding protein